MKTLLDIILRFDLDELVNRGKMMTVLGNGIEVETKPSIINLNGKYVPLLTYTQLVIYLLRKAAL